MSDETRIIDLLLHWEELREQDQSVTPEDLCRDSPELLEGVKRRIRELLDVNSLLDTDTDDPTPDRAASAEWTAAALRYQPLRFHARGGLGEVYLARDEELNREVALKRMQGTHVRDAESRRRFLREAEITARLEHPGVVPVHGLVHDRAGEPCYAMRFIQGESLQDAIRHFHEADDKPGRDAGERSLAFRHLLGRFVSVCNTVAYAHSRGIVHRDLKPANIMLGKYGETLVVDWGLAKPFTPGETERAVGEETLTLTAPAGGPGGTELGQAVGTPAYMSPEQAAGRPDQLGPASDIYSLGATLYTILAGRAPFGAGRAGDMFVRIQQGDLLRPRRVKPGVPPALEAVCLKALALKPEERYATAAALAGDVEKWLADEPVSNYREPWTARAWRWMRKHTGTASGVAAAVLVGLIGLAVGAVLLGQANQQLVLANVQLDLARREAEANFAKAARNFTLARQAVQNMLADVGLRELENVPKQDRARRRLVERALAFHELFLDERRHDPGFRFESAAFLLQASQFRLQLGQDPQSQQQMREALTRAEELARERPDDAERQILLGQAWSTLGWSRYIAGDADEAEMAYRKGLEAYARLDGRRAEQNRAFVLKNLGILLRNTGRTEDAEKVERESVALHQKLVDDNPEFLVRYQLAAAHNNLGNLLGQTRRLDEALEQHRRALELRQSLHRERPEDVGVRSELAMSHDNLGILYHFKKRPDESEAAFQEAVQVAERLGRDFPDRIDYTAQYGRICMNRADALRNFGKPAEALRALDQAIPALQAILEKEPRHGPSLRWLSNALGLRAEIHYDARRWAPAMAAWDECARLDAGRLSESARLLAVVCRARLGRHAEVARAAEELQQQDAMRRLLASYGRNARFDLACTLAIAVAAAESDTALPSDHRTILAESYKKRALNLLHDSFRAGDLQPDALLRGLKEDKDLEALRACPEFHELVQSVQNKSSTRRSPES